MPCGIPSKDLESLPESKACAQSESKDAFAPPAAMLLEPPKARLLALKRVLNQPDLIARVWVPSHAGDVKPVRDGP
jgi:hypothetical protein